MVTLRQADYTEQMCQLKPSLFFFLTPEPFQVQPRISFRISKGWFPSPPANPSPSRPLGTQDALHAAKSASSWIHGDPKEQTHVTPRPGACLEPSSHKQSYIECKAAFQRSMLPKKQLIDNTHSKLATLKCTPKRCLFQSLGSTPKPPSFGWGPYLCWWQWQGWWQWWGAVPGSAWGLDA